jgi:type I restriction enzyme S subunit
MGKELPNEWASTSLDQISQFVIGGDWGKDSEKYWGEDFVRVSCIRGSEIRNWEKEKGKTASIRLVKKSSLEKRQLQEGDLLVEISGGGPDQPVGRVIRIDNEALSHNPELPKVGTNFLRLLRLVESVDSSLINYYLQYFYHSGEVVKYQGGSNNLRNLKFKEYSKIDIPIPPLPEQKRIVAKLDALFGHLDALKSKLDRIPELLKNFRQQVLTLAVTGKFTDTQNTWPIYKLKVVSTKVGSGSTPRGGSAAYKTEGIPLVRSMNIHFNGIKYDGLAFIDEEQAEALKNVEIMAGDVLLNITGASIGRVCVAEDEIVGGRVNQHVAIIRTSESLIPEFLNIYLSSPIMQDWINKENYGVTRPALTKGQILDLDIPLPSIEEQRKIIARVNDFFNLSDRIGSQYLSFKDNIDNLPQAVLNKAFKGELVPQNPNDEPASFLLKRIKEERQKEKKLPNKIVRAKVPKSELSISAYSPRELINKNMKILEVLKESKQPLTPKEVWQASEHKDDIDAFYAALKIEIENKKVKESSDKKYIELA